MRPAFEPLEHTADLALQAWGTDLAELFQNAALGMFHFVTDPAAVRESRGRDIRLEADDLEGLLVEWLSELNFLHEQHDELYARAEVDSVDAEACRLSGQALGESFEAGRHCVHTEIKAVTFHELQLERDEDGWRAQVIFDV